MVLIMLAWTLSAMHLPSEGAGAGTEICCTEDSVSCIQTAQIWDPWALPSYSHVRTSMCMQDNVTALWASGTVSILVLHKTMHGLLLAGDSLGRSPWR
jgi:hypothetical protein